MQVKPVVFTKGVLTAVSAIPIKGHLMGLKQLQSINATLHELASNAP